MDMTLFAKLKKMMLETMQGAGAIKGDRGDPGKDATINGENAVKIAAGENVTIEQNAGTLTISSSGCDWPARDIGHGLKIVDGDLMVDAVSDFSGDNTLPMTAAGVQATVGNIEALLGTI